MNVGIDRLVCAQPQLDSGFQPLDVLSERRQPFCERMFLPLDHSNRCLEQFFLIAPKRRKRDFFIRTTVIQEEVSDWGEMGSKILWHSVLKLPILFPPVRHSHQK